MKNLNELSGEFLLYIEEMAHANETAEEYSFKEKSSWGAVEGTVIIKESK